MSMVNNKRLQCIDSYCYQKKTLHASLSVALTRGTVRTLALRRFAPTANSQQPTANSQQPTATLGQRAARGLLTAGSG